MSPQRFWHGEFQLGHLVYWTSSTIKRVVRSTLAAEAYTQYQKLLKKHSGFELSWQRCGLLFRALSQDP